MSPKSPEEKRIALLHELSSASQPISLPEILDKLGSGFAERSVRRWLSDMVKDGLVEIHGSKRSTKYCIAKKSKNHTASESGCFTTESLKTIQSLKRPIFERNPVTYSDSWFDSYKPNTTYYIPADTRKKLHALGLRFQKEEAAGTYANQIFERLLIDLSYNSSRLEGNTYSLLDTKKLLLEGQAASGKLDVEKTMILNHKEAIRYLVESAAKIEVSTQTIYTLHYLLSDGLLEPDDSGRVRKSGVHVSGSTYIPLEDPNDLKARLERITKKAALIKDPYEQSLFLLVHISYLQAFSDVNKRTARLAANIPLIKKNLVPLSFNDIEKDDYISAIIAIYELQNVQPLCDLFSFSYMRTCALYETTVKAMGFDEVRVRYRIQRRELTRELILSSYVGQQIQEYITKRSYELVKEQDRKAFVEDVLEDLKIMDASRIAGLGISLDQLNMWLRLRDQSK